MSKNNPNYLSQNELITDRSGNPYQYFHYSTWGESFAQAEATQGSFSSSYRFNAKELDQETRNYYGARYYHPKWSVWLGVDPLASKYQSMSPYVFTGNNPIMLVDPDGRDIIVLLDPKRVFGAGHMAFLIGNKDDGYRLYSDNGTTNGIGSSGPSDDAPEMGEQHFDSLAEFARIYNKDEDGNAIYTSAYEIKTTKKQDDEMQEAGKNPFLKPTILLTIIVLMHAVMPYSLAALTVER